MRFTVYDAATGRIKRYGQCPDEDLQAQALVGEAVVAGYIDPGEKWLPGGVATDLPPRPTPWHEFDHAAGVWALDLGLAWAQVRRARDEMLKATDWMTLRATEAGAPLAADWAAYRQALRDITQQPDPTNIQWPAPPA